MKKKEPVIIAVCGKGGVGKTSISALLTKFFAEQNSNKVLAIDADPAIGLSFPLGITVKKTVDNIRNDLIKRIKRGEKASGQVGQNDKPTEIKGLEKKELEGVYEITWENVPEERANAVDTSLESMRLNIKYLRSAKGHWSPDVREHILKGLSALMVMANAETKTTKKYWRC